MSTTTTTEQLYTAHAGECRDIVFILPRVPLRFSSLSFSSSSYACVFLAGVFFFFLAYHCGGGGGGSRDRSVSRQFFYSDLFLVVVVYAMHTNT